MSARRISLQATTQYTIDAPGVDPEVLQKSVIKHCDNLSLYLSQKPIAEHTQEAFDTLQEQLRVGSDKEAPMIILDSGCGTGRSTLLLGRLYPDHVVIGVDRSIARLSKNDAYESQNVKEQTQQSTKKESSNVFLVRAELADFWRLWLATPLGTIEKHFLLYPNPCPKKRRFQNRWYAHPAFPMIRQLGGDEIVVRSNWKPYLEDFGSAMSIAEERDDTPIAYESDGAVELDPIQEAWTNFEQKYFNCGEIAYELCFRKR